MAAAVVARLGELPTYIRVARPDPGVGQVLVQVSAAAINPIDLRLATGKQYGITPAVPYIAGSEGVGQVVAGPRELLGRRVRFETARGAPGALAEFCVADATTCVIPPESLPAAVAAALGVAGMAAWIPLVDKAGLRPGERVLVLGATGAVGRLAVQVAKLQGAQRVVAAGRDVEALAQLGELGADAMVPLAGQSEEELQQAFRGAAEGELDVVFDPLWGAPVQAALRACAPSARVVQLGESAGSEATLNSGVVRGRQLTIIGHSSPSTSWDLRARAYRELAERAVRGEIRVEVEQIRLADVKRAWERQAGSPHVKLVLVP